MDNRRCWAASDPDSLLKWFKKLRIRAPSYGYNIKRGKCFLISKDERARRVFKDEIEDGTLVWAEGTRYLGAPIGTERFKRQFYREKLEKIMNKVENLNRLAKTSPHAAYHLYQRSVKHEITYMQRVGLYADQTEEIVKAMRNMVRTMIGGQ